MALHTPSSSDVAAGGERSRPATGLAGAGVADVSGRTDPAADGSVASPPRDDEHRKTPTHHGPPPRVAAATGGARAAEPAESARLGTVGWLILLGLMVVGGVLRFWRLGELGLIVDEGYQATAVTAILERGVPLMETGYVYSRSFLFLYQETLSTWLLGFSEWSMRLPAAVWGTAGIAVAGWFGRCLFGWRVGLVLAGLMAVSAWEVEYARYARFYTQFQAIYLVGLIAWYRGFVQMRVGWRWAFAGVFLLAVITHELGVMLGLSFLMILPLRGYSLRRKAAYFVLSGVCGVVWKVVTKTEDVIQKAIGGLPGWGVPEAERASQTAPPPPRGLPLPDLWFVRNAAAEYGPWLWAAGVLLLVVAGTIAYLALAWPTRGSSAAPFSTVGASRAGRSDRAIRVARAVLLVGMAGLATLNLISAVMVLAVLYLAYFVRRSAQLRRPEVLLTLAWTVAATLGWIAWHRLSPTSSLTKGLQVALEFPNLYDYFFKWMVYGWPALLVLMGLGFVPLMRRAVAPGDTVGPGWFVLASLLVPMLVTSELVWQYSESRYFLHLYPLVLLAVAVLIVGVAERIGTWLGWDRSATTPPATGSTATESAEAAAARRAGTRRIGLTVAGVAAVTMLASEDLNLAKAWDVSTRTYTSARDPLRSVLNFPFHAGFHQDLKTGSEAARPQIQDHDLVIIVGPPHQAVTYKHYLGRIDYIVTTLNPYLTLQQQDDGFWLDLKSGGRLVYRDEDLQSIVDAAEPDQTVWLFSDWALVAPECWYLSNAEPALKELTRSWMLSRPAWHVGGDGITTVHRFRAETLQTDAAAEPTATTTENPATDSPADSPDSAVGTENIRHVGPADAGDPGAVGDE